MKNTRQLNEWTKEFGREYTDRNMLSIEEMESSYKQKYGITRTELNMGFLDNIEMSARILEVGSNIGNQLACMQNIGFMNLYGIEPQEYAVEISRQRTKGTNLIKGSAFDLPFKDNYFDMVFTSGVLIHINPDEIKLAMEEIYRCSKKWIWGFEYYSNEYIEIPYRGKKNLLWKADFAGIYRQYFSDLKIVKTKRVSYLDDPVLEDEMFLLKKG